MLRVNSNQLWTNKPLMNHKTPKHLKSVRQVVKDNVSPKNNLDVVMLCMLTHFLELLTQIFLAYQFFSRTYRRNFDLCTSRKALHAYAVVSYSLSSSYCDIISSPCLPSRKITAFSHKFRKIRIINVRFMA